jgi:heme exporter protein C
MWSLINGFLSPKKFVLLTNQMLPWLQAFFVFLFSYGIVGGLILAPADYVQGDGFRIIYVHVPCAFLSLFIYVVMACASVGCLVFRLKLAPLIIRESVLLGGGFTFLALLTGSLWGKPMWGTWWIWDARLTSELILFFLYMGIFLFQSAVAQKQKGERALAILILIGLIDIPIIHYSVYWWNTLHQGATLNIFSPSTIDKSMLYPLLSMIAAFLIYYSIILFSRIRYELIAKDARHHWLRQQK